MRRALAPLALLSALACQSAPTATPEQAAAAVKGWMPTGVKGNLQPQDIQCASKDGARFLCAVEVNGGGELKVRATKAADTWSMELAEPIIVTARVEELIQKDDTRLGVASMPACGDRVRPAKQGDVFKCLIRDMAGKQVGAAEVTVTDAAKSVVSFKRLTDIVDRGAPLAKKITSWITEQGQTPGEVTCPAPQRHYSLPDTEFQCTSAGVERAVVVKITDYRASATLTWAPE